MSHLVSHLRRCRGFTLAIVSLLLATIVGAAETNSASQSWTAGLKSACAEKQIDNRLNALAAVGKALSLSEIPEAIQSAETLKQLRERVVFTEATLKRWGELAPAEAFARISEMPESMSKVECIRSVVPFYAKKDIGAATGAAVKMNPGRSRNEAVQMIAEIRARDDGKAAVKWVNELPDGFPKAQALHDIYFIWVHLDPAGISSTVQALPPGDTRNALIMNVAGDWAAKDPASAIKWAEALPEESEKETALATLAESWADTDPMAAAQFAIKLSPPDLRERAVLATLERWATQDPTKALSWTLKSSDETLKAHGVARILNTYVPVAPEAAGRWVEQLPAGAVRESAIGSYVEAVRMWNPGVGARLALLTADASEREQRVEPCIVLWLAWDPAAAKLWLKGTDFSDAIKNRWLQEQSKDV
jgi:hypothetical protein